MRALYLADHVVFDTSPPAAYHSLRRHTRQANHFALKIYSTVFYYHEQINHQSELINLNFKVSWVVIFDLKAIVHVAERLEKKGKTASSAYHFPARNPCCSSLHWRTQQASTNSMDPMRLCSLDKSLQRNNGG